MAIVYKKKYPIPMPEGAKIVVRRGQKLARWKNGRGQEFAAEVLDDQHVMFVSECLYIRYRDGQGRMRRKSTRCRDRQAAEKILADILTSVDKVRAGVMSPQEMTASRQIEAPMARHTDDYLSQLAVRTIRGRRVSPKHVVHVRDRLDRVIRECGFQRLKDIDRRAVQRWMNKLVQMPRDANDPKSQPLAPRTINMHRSTIISFCNWCVSEGRLAFNPLAGLRKVDEPQPARRRRALTEDEIARLLKAAKERPLQAALTIQTGKNKGKPLAKVSDRERRRLRRLGEERALLHKLMMLTGLRRNEAASLTVSAVCLDEHNPYVHVEGKHAKSGRAATLPLRADLIDELRKHLAWLAEEHGGSLPQDARLFGRNRDFLPVFNRDIRAAGIAKRDAQGRTVDVRCLRHTFATLLARNGVMPATAQRLMRHSDIRLTMNTYTHLDLADTAGAVAALPRF